ncbi:YbbR-like domain-containing protein [Mariniflexile ostreae]|uniref:YbbR-like domain-containing protein n=1 Tax=Mariniflexile ostreae TaxID=1520892 RepID=A0ABV5FEJ7_9FLAO
MIKILKSKIIAGFKSRRINVFLLFLLISFIILIFSKLSKQYTNTIPFNIHKVNVPPEAVILNDSNRVLHITLKTYGFGWLKYYIKKPNITIDFESDVYRTSSKFVWFKSKAYLKNTQFGDQVELLNLKPDTLVFRYDVNMVKKVPIVLDSDIKYSPGYDVFDSIKTVPDSIAVVGAKEFVSKIKNIKTNVLKLNEVKTNIDKAISLKLPKNNQGLKFSNETVKVKAHVERFTEGTLKVPVDLVNVPEGLSLNFFPKIVHVTYYTSLNNFNTISSKDFKVECDYNKLTQTQSFLIPQVVKAPENVKNVKIHQQHIEFIIKE